MVDPIGSPNEDLIKQPLDELASHISFYHIVMNTCRGFPTSFWKIYKMLLFALAYPWTIENA